MKSGVCAKLHGGDDDYIPAIRRFHVLGEERRSQPVWPGLVLRAEFLIYTVASSSLAAKSKQSALVSVSTLQNRDLAGRDHRS